MGFTKHLGISQIYSFMATTQREMGMREKSTTDLQVQHWCGAQIPAAEQKWETEHFRVKFHPPGGRQPLGKGKSWDDTALL